MGRRRKYKSDYCFTNKDLFDNFDSASLSLPEAKDRSRGKRTRREYVSNVFMYCLYLIILDIIENNTTFVLPLFGNREGCFYVKVFDGDIFKKMYSGGKFYGIDFLKSNFKGYQIYFQYTYRGGVKEKPIYISKNLKDVFYKYINEGREYY